MDIEKVANIVVGSALLVHRTLGPGLLESAYQSCLTHELRFRGLDVDCERVLPIVYRGLKIDCSYRLDLVVENSVLVEIKSVEKLHPIHSAQMITYLRLSKISIGLLINFSEQLLKHGLRRFVNEYDESSRPSRLRGE